MDRDYDSSARPREGALEQSDQGFRIRGRASRGGERGPSRPYHDPDQPRRRERDSRYDDTRNDDRRYRPRHDDYYRGNDEYVDTSYSYDAPEEPPGNSGDQDVATEERPIKFLLVRGLKPNVDEAILSKGLEKLYQDPEEKNVDSQPLSQPSHVVPPGAPNMPPGPSQSGATPGSLKRVFLIRDRVTDKSTTYGFAEFHSSSDAKAALSKANQMGDKCTISSKAITIDFPHLGVFPPVPPAQMNDNEHFRFELQPGTFHQYYDTRYWASTMIVNAESPHPSTDLPPMQDGTNKPVKKRPLAVVDVPDGFSGERTKKPKASGAPLAIAEMWQKKQAELRGEDVEATDPSKAHLTGTTGANHESGTDPIMQSFVFQGQRNGKQGKWCLLCMTQLDAKVSVEDHVRRSQKHEQNLKDDAKFKQGFENLKKWNLNESDTVIVKVERVQQPEYKDRAKERRQEEAKMGVSGGAKIKLSLKGAQDKKESSKPTAPSYGKGLNILQKAGWKEGQGLGSGEGVAAPIEQSMYAAGVGLGHESSKKGDAVEEAARLTKDDGGSFLQKTKEVARERFERLS